MKSTIFIFLSMVSIVASAELLFTESLWAVPSMVAIGIFGFLAGYYWKKKKATEDDGN